MIEFPKVGRKYHFTGHELTQDGVLLRQIVAARDFGFVKTGELGGWIESEANLSHHGASWIERNARASGTARIEANATLMDWACVKQGLIRGHAIVRGRAVVDGHVVMLEHASANADVRLTTPMTSPVLTLGGYIAIFGNGDLSKSGDYRPTELVHINLSPSMNAFSRLARRWRHRMGQTHALSPQP